MANGFEKYQLKAYMLPKVNDEVLESNFEVEFSETAPIGNFSTGFNFYIYQSYENINKMFKALGDRNFYNVINRFELYLGGKENREDFQELARKRLGLEITNDVYMHMVEIANIFGINGNVQINSDDGLDDIKRALERYVDSYVESGPSTVIAVPKLNTNNIFREAITFRKIMGYLRDGLEVLSDGGNLVLRINDTYNTATIKMLQLCKTLFDYVYVYKPYYSKPYKSENYLVCITYNRDKYEGIQDKLNGMFKEVEKNKDMFALDIMSDINIDKSMLIVMRYINMMLGGLQHKETNKVMAYVNNKNYFGDEYHDALEEQKNALEFVDRNFLSGKGSDEIVDALRNALENIKKNI